MVRNNLFTHAAESIQDSNSFTEYGWLITCSRRNLSSRFTPFRCSCGVFYQITFKEIHRLRFETVAYILNIWAFNCLRNARRDSSDTYIQFLPNDLMIKNKLERKPFNSMVRQVNLILNTKYWAYGRAWRDWPSLQFQIARTVAVQL